jgi:addiction module HigA family antidote
MMMAARKTAGGAPRRRAAQFHKSRREPVHPGYFLESRFLTPMKITQQALARELGISRRRVNEMIRGKRGISPDTAVRLASHFGNEPEFWLELQLAWDVHAALKKLKLTRT